MNARKSLSIALVIALPLVLQSCATIDSGFVQDYGFATAAEDSTAAVALIVHNEREVSVRIENKSDQPIAIDWDACVYKTPTGESKRLIHSGVRYIARDQPQAKSTIATNGMLSDILVPADAVIYSQPVTYVSSELVNVSSGGWSVSPWVPIPPEGSSFGIAYVENGETKFLTCAFTKEAMEQLRGEILGQVTAENTYWHLLFISDPTKDRSELLKKAQALAEEKYGAGVGTTNPKFNSSWKLASLLLYFDFLGWVEEASITVDVVKNKNQ